MLDSNKIKKQFPIFERKINDKLLIFLDSAASAQKPLRVIEAMSEIMKKNYANVNRGIYVLSQETTEQVELARKKVAKFIGAFEDEIIFTKNATESINLIMYSWGRKYLKKGDVVVLTEMEHHSNIVPWQILKESIGVELVWLSVGEDGYLKIPEKLQNVKLVCVTHVSNVLGTINNIKELASWAHEMGAKILVDGAQGITNVGVNVQELDVDWYVFSGHKIYGPSGVGVLYGKRDILKDMPPFLGGGDMIIDVSKNRTEFKDPPARFEAGTPPIVEIIGLGAAIDFVNDVGMNSIREHNRFLSDYAMKKLEGIKIYGPSNIENRGAVISFNLEGVHPHDIGSILDNEGIAVRTGHHCAQVLMDKFGVAGMVRASFGVYSCKEDVDALQAGLQKVRAIFGV